MFARRLAHAALSRGRVRPLPNTTVRYCSNDTKTKATPTNRNESESETGRDVEKEEEGDLGVYTTSTVPDLSKDDLSKFFELPVDALQEGVSADLKECFSLTGAPQLMCRETMLDVLGLLESKEKDMVMLTGHRWSGKSATLATAVAYARANDWITMYIPRPRDWVNEFKSDVVGTGTALPVVRSALTKEYFGHPLAAVDILKTMKELHYDKLAQLPQKMKHDHGMYNKDGDTSLAIIVERGIRSKLHASNAVYDLRMELGLVEEHPVLIAVDEMNTLYWPSPFYAQGKIIDTSEMLLPRAFRCLDTTGKLLDEHRMKNGMMLYATTRRYPLQKNTKGPFIEDQRLSSPARKDLAAEGGKVFNIKPFTEEEFRSTLVHYVATLDKRLLQDVMNPEVDVTYLQSLTMGNPAKLLESVSTGDVAGYLY